MQSCASARQCGSVAAHSFNPPEMMMRLKTSILAIATAMITVSAPPAMAQDIGVASCDAFLRTFQSCIVDNAPADQKAKATTEFEKMKANWKAVATTDAGKTELDTTCKKTAETLKVGAPNCKW